MQPLKTAADLERQQNQDAQQAYNEQQTRTRDAMNRDATDAENAQRDARQDSQDAQAGTKINRYVYDAQGKPTGEAVLMNGTTITGAWPAATRTSEPPTIMTDQGVLERDPTTGKWAPIQVNGKTVMPFQRASVAGELTPGREATLTNEYRNKWEATNSILDKQLQQTESDLEAEFNRRMTAWRKANSDAGQDEIQSTAQGLRAEIEGRKRAAEAEYHRQRQAAADAYDANLAAIGGGVPTPATRPMPAPGAAPQQPVQFYPSAADIAKIPVGKVGHFANGQAWLKQADGTVIRVK